MRGVVTTVLELAGISLLVVCAAFIFWPAAFGVAGAGLLMVSRGIAK